MAQVNGKHNGSDRYFSQDDPLFPLDLKTEAVDDQVWRETIEGRLEPLNDHRLYAFKHHHTHLKNLLYQNEAPWIVSVEGEDGVGKTTLADRVVRDLIRHHRTRFVDVAWICGGQMNFVTRRISNKPKVKNEQGLPTTTEKQVSVSRGSLMESVINQLFPVYLLVGSLHERVMVLKALLKRKPYLVIIDNLQTKADYQVLLPMLRDWANPTKFVLLSRQPIAEDNDVHSLPLCPLREREAIQLLTTEGKERELATLANASPEQLKALYNLVGGNPLALRLAIGLLYALSLNDLVTYLKQPWDQKAQKRLTHLYWKGWHTLVEDEHKVLLTMPLTAFRGSHFEHLAAVCGLEESHLQQTLQRLADYGLIEIGDDPIERRYRIHPLAEIFLLIDVIQWTWASFP